MSCLPDGADFLHLAPSAKAPRAGLNGQQAGRLDQAVRRRRFRYRRRRATGWEAEQRLDAMSECCLAAILPQESPFSPPRCSAKHRRTAPSSAAATKRSEGAVGWNSPWPAGPAFLPDETDSRPSPPAYDILAASGTQAVLSRGCPG